MMKLNVIAVQRSPIALSAGIRATGRIKHPELHTPVVYAVVVDGQSATWFNSQLHRVICSDTQRCSRGLLPLLLIVSGTALRKELQVNPAAELRRIRSVDHCDNLQ